MTLTLQALVDSLPLPVLVIEPPHYITLANAQALKILGNQIIGAPFATVLRQPKMIAAIERAFSSHSPQIGAYVFRSGHRDIAYRVQITPQNRALILSFQDQSKMQELEKLHRDFTANVSHELRTPLAALSGFIETLQGPAKEDPAAQEHFLNIMQKETARMADLVRDLLSLSHAQERAAQMPKEMFGIAQLTVQSLDALAPLIKTAQAQIRFDDHSKGAKIHADSGQFQQLMNNLIENALRYGGAGKPIDVVISAPDYDPVLRRVSLRLSVQDQGAGIAAHHLPRLTERFYRIQSDRARHSGGTGLGLAIVKHIVNRHQGRLEINSTPGKGSEFTIILPIIEEKSELS